MNAQHKIIRLIKEISGQANVLTIPRLFINLTKNHRAALVLSQCIYWTGKSSLKNGWFYKSYKDWHSELGIPRTSMIRAMERLTSRGWIETTVMKVHGAPTCHYRVNMELLATVIMEDLDSTETVLSKVPERDDG